MFRIATLPDLRRALRDAYGKPICTKRKFHTAEDARIVRNYRASRGWIPDPDRCIVYACPTCGPGIFHYGHDQTVRTNG